MTAMRTAVRRMARTFAILCWIASVIPTLASAQTKEGWLGWSSPHTAEYFPSADAACRSQWEYYQGGLSRYIGVNLDPGGVRGGCSWTQYQYLCLEETGARGNCGTIWPTFVELRCASGFVPRMGECVKLQDLIPERPCNCNNGGAENRQIGHPIVLSTGAKILQARDYASADGLFVIGRSYRSMPFGMSLNFIDPPLGLAGGWAFNFAYELQLSSFSGSPTSPSARVAVVAPDGTAYDFVMQSGGAFTPEGAAPTIRPYYVPTDLKLEYLGTLPSDLSTLQSATSQWKLTDRDDNVWTFQTVTRPNRSTPFSIGRPTSRVARGGYRWDFAYRSDNSLQTITDSFGRQATFNWSMFYVTSAAIPPAGSLPWPEAVANVSLPDGTSLRYSYDPPPAMSAPSTSQIQRLVKVERLNASSVAIDSTTYAYGDSRFARAITAITDFNGDQIASYAYDSRGRAVSSALANNAEAYTITNTEAYPELIRTVTTPMGKVVDYHYRHYDNGIGTSDIRLASISSHATANTPASTSSITYGSNSFIATETDEEGHVTSYSRDSKGRPTTIVEASGKPQARTTTITWNATFNLPDQVVRPDLQTDFSYYPNGQLHTRTETDTTAQSIPYSTNGQTRTWTYTWDTNGRLLSINGPRPVDTAGKDDLVTFAYDTAGNLQTSTNGLGQVTTFADYDVNGRPGTMTDPNGVVTAFTYDILGRTKTITVKHPSNSVLDATTTLEYDSRSRVSGITLPATEKLFIDYNASDQLMSIRAADGERHDYAYDADSNIVGETIKRSDGSTSQLIKRSFDELSRLLTETAGAQVASHYAYDKVGNLTGLTSPKGTATTQAFDPLNRLVTTVWPDSGSITRTYDSGDHVLSSTDPISATTQFIRDGFGDVIREISPDRGTSTYYYNEAGQLTASIDGRGQRIDFSRDILGRVTQKVPVGRPPSETIAYTWDTPALTGSYAVGRLSSVIDATGTTSFGYDHRGNLIAKRQTIGTGPADLAYTYDLANRITQIAYPSGRLVQYAYDTKGRISQIQTKMPSDPAWTMLANGFTYEPFASVETIALGNGLTVANDWSDDGRLASRRLYTTSGGVGLSSLAYTYDDNGNIGAVHDLLNDANNIYYGYDLNDRLMFASMTVGSPAGGTETYGYTSGTNRLASIVSASGTRSISYDGRGNTLSEARPGGASVSASYDGYARLLTYNRSGDPPQTNAYNGLDDRVGVTSGSTTHSFVYDPDGRLLGEYGASPSDVVAETIWLSPSAANDNQPFGGDDGVGGYAPLAVATGAGSSAELYWVHGNHLGVPIAITDASGTTAVPPAYTMAGFPGQTKTLSDIYYNRYRDYDSSFGRYIQTDPIGLEGGSNPYLYAEANPFKYIDPMGLEIGNQRRFFPESYPKPKPTRPRSPDCVPPPPPIDWCGSTGTGWIVPESPGGVNISNACKTHDACYASSTNRYTCDLGLMVDSYNQCRSQGAANSKCALIGTVYFLGVRAGGYFSYEGTGRRR